MEKSVAEKVCSEAIDVVIKPVNEKLRRLVNKLASANDTMIVAMFIDYIADEVKEEARSIYMRTCVERVKKLLG